MTLGQKIKEARVKRGLTQKQLVGDYITRNMLSKIENDSATPSVRTLEFLAQKLAMPVSYFLEDSELSDGTSPDGLDNMRDAYRAGKWDKCIALLQESKTAGTTDEGYLLYARAGAAAAREALTRGDIEAAVSFAEMADYYNKEGIYYSHRIDAEMNLIFAEFSLYTGKSEFEPYIREFERIIVHINYADRYILDKAEYLLSGGKAEEASKLLESADPPGGRFQAKYLWLKGSLQMESGKYSEAVGIISEAEGLAAENPLLLSLIYKNLETCYRELEDYKMAYHYAAKQLG